MLPVIILVALFGLSARLGAGRWQKKTTTYFVIASIALLQTVLVLLFMYTMKVPKGSYLP